MARTQHDAKALTTNGARRGAHEYGEVILLSLTSVLALLWAIVLVTHFHAPLSGFGQSLWLMH